jgi:hypothetical protein
LKSSSLNQAKLLRNLIELFESYSEFAHQTDQVGRSAKNGKAFRNQQAPDKYNPQTLFVDLKWDRHGDWY